MSCGWPSALLDYVGRGEWQGRRSCSSRGRVQPNRFLIVCMCMCVCVVDSAGVCLCVCEREGTTLHVCVCVCGRVQSAQKFCQAKMATTAATNNNNNNDNNGQ